MTLQEVQQQARDWGARRSAFGKRIPAVAEPVTVFGFSTVPVVYGTQVQLLQFQAKANWFFLAAGIVLSFTGAGQPPNPGDVSYTVDIDRPLGDAAAGFVEKNYGNVPFPLGSFDRGLIWPVEFEHRNTEVIRIKATPVANMGLGATNFFTACLFGWTWPESRADH